MKKILLVCVNGLLVIAFVVCLAVSGSIKKTLLSQQAASVWAGQNGERFAQVSAFLPSGAEFDEMAVYNLNESIEKSLTDASLEAGEGGSLYADAWSAVGEVFIIGARGSTTAQAYGVGGSFFLFHPLYLRDGSYISQNDIMKDRVVLDEELAWRLFGSVNLAGLEVTIGGRQHIIAGVVSREDDFASSRAYTGGAGLFMSYESLLEQTGGMAEITCYEIVMPDPISGFALQTITDAFQGKGAVIVENSARYSLSGVLGVFRGFGDRSMRADGVIFPYWENAARYTEDWLALLLILTFVFISFPVVCGVVYGIRGIRFIKKSSVSSVKKRLEERDDREAEKYRQEHEAEFVIPTLEEIIREVRDGQEKEK